MAASDFKYNGYVISNNGFDPVSLPRSIRPHYKFDEEIEDRPSYEIAPEAFKTSLERVHGD